MAYTDFDDDEARQAALLGSGAAPAAQGASMGGAMAGGAQPGSQGPSGGPGTGFVNFNSLLGLNSAGGHQMADAVTGDLSDRAGAVTQAASGLNRAANAAGATAQNHNPLQAGQVQQDASDVAARGRTLQQMGPGQALSDLYGAGRTYTSGENAMDSALAGGVAGGALRGVGAQFGHFGGLLGLDTQPLRGGGGGGAAEDDRGGGNGGSGGGSGGRTMPLGPDPQEEERRRRLAAGRTQRVETRSNPFGPLLGGG